MSSKIGQVVRDTVIVLFSILIAVLLVKTGTIDTIVKLFEGSFVLTALIAGILFTSVFTTAVGIATFLVLGADNYNPFLTALVGGVGSLIGDLIIFRFVRETIVSDIKSFFSKKTQRETAKFTKRKIVAIGLMILAGVIIASPLPDELGIALLALSRLNSRYFGIASYFFNTAGIFALILIGEAF